MNINLKNLGVNILVAVIAVASTFAISQNINKTPKTSSQKNATNSTENIVKDFPQAEEKKSEANIAEIKKDNTPKLIDLRGKEIRSYKDVDSLEVSDKVKGLLRSFTSEEGCGDHCILTPTVGKVYGDYVFVDHGINSGLYGPANLSNRRVISGEAKVGDMVMLFDPNTKCADILRAKIPHEIIDDVFIDQCDKIRHY